MKSRQLATSMWDDGYFMSLNDKERLAFFLHIHNQHIDMTGVYELPIELMSFRLRIDDVEATRIREKFEKDGKFYFFKSWVYIANWSRHNIFSPIPAVMKKFAADFNKIPAAVRRYFIEEKGLKYDLPFSTSEISIEGISVIVKERDTVKEKDIDNRKRGIDRLPIGYGKERIDPDSIPDLDDWSKKNGAKSKIVSGFAVILLTLLFGVFCINPIHATTITRKVVVSQSVARSSVELKSPIPKKTATSTRSEGEPKTRGGVSSQPTKPTQHAYNPRPVVEVRVDLPDFKKEIARQIKQAFPQDAREMIAIAMAESGLNCDRINGMDSNGVQSVGLFQINDGRWFTQDDIANLSDCNHNIERAKTKYSYGRFNPWGAYWNKAYQRYLWIYDEI